MGLQVREKNLPRDMLARAAPRGRRVAGQTLLSADRLWSTGGRLCPYGSDRALHTAAPALGRSRVHQRCMRRRARLCASGAEVRLVHDDALSSSAMLQMLFEIDVGSASALTQLD
jgi:hypothetical protein